MKVLLVPSSGPVPPGREGGAVRLYVYQLTRHLGRLGINATAIATKNRPDEPYEEELIAARIKRIRAPKFPMKLPWKLSEAAGIANDYLFGALVTGMLKNYDIIHANVADGLGIGNWLANTRFVTKLICTCHSSSWTTDYVSLFDSIVNRASERFLLRRAKAVIALSPTQRRNLVLKAGLPEDKVFCVPNGVDIDLFRPGIPCKDFRRKYDLDGYKVLLFVGRITYEKGVDVLIRAVDALVNEYKMKNIKCLMVGSLTYGGVRIRSHAMRIMTMARRLGLTKNVIFTGSMSHEELRKLYVASDVLVLPSRREAFGLVVIEAMATGKPVVGARVGGIRDLILEGITGHSFPPDDYKALAQILATLLSDEPLMKKMGLRARIIAEQEYGWESVARRVLALYDAISVK